MQANLARMAIPASHIDLLDRALPAVLTTAMPDGRLQSTIVWYERDDPHVLINTMREFQKARNLDARPLATLLVQDGVATPRHGPTPRWIELRTRATRDGQDAMTHLDALGRRYTGVSPYFGGIVPVDLAEHEHPQVYRLTPVSICAGPSYIHSSRQISAADVTERPATNSECGREPAIPDSHRDLLQRALTVALSTRMPDQSAQTQPVWCSLAGNDVLINTTRQRRKGRNLAADPRATVLAIDPDDSSRWVEIRGDVELIERGAGEHLDELTRYYTEHDQYYGGIYPVEQAQRETRVIVRLHPRRITCDAIHRA